MKGLYNGTYMRALRLFGYHKLKLAKLAKEALKRLVWVDLYDKRAGSKIIDPERDQTPVCFRPTVYLFMAID